MDKKTKLRRIRDRLDEAIDHISSMDTDTVFTPIEKLDNTYMRRTISLINSVFGQWFDDIKSYRPEVIYRPVKGLSNKNTNEQKTYSPIKEIVPFNCLESLLTERQRDEFFADYQNRTAATRSAGSVLIGVRDGDKVKVVADVYDSINIDEDFILNSDVDSLKKVVLAATYIHFLCDQIDYDRGLSG